MSPGQAMSIALILPPSNHESDSLSLRWLQVQLEARGHTVSAVTEPETPLDHFDAVISSSAPGWLAQHRCHIVYSAGDQLPHGSQSTALPDHVRRLVTPSEASARRFEHRGWDQPIMVAPPVSYNATAIPAVPARIICYAEASSPNDRLDVLIAAFSMIDDPYAELRIAGGMTKHRLDSPDLDRRVRFLGPIDAEPRTDELAAAMVVVVLEPDQGWSHLGADAMQAGTPLVAATDGGGVTEIVEHGVNGLLSEPVPEDVSWAIRHISSTPRLRWSLGLQAERRAAELTSDRLIDEIEDLISPAPRPRALMLTTYPIDPMIGGGQRRARFLSRSLGERCDVTVLVNTSPTDSIRRRVVEAGLTQVEVPKSAAQQAAELDLFHAMDQTPVDDITAARLSKATPRYSAELSARLEQSDLVISTQPFLTPCIPQTEVPIVHDSQNVEVVLKAALLPDSPGGAWLLDAVSAAETEACERAAVITACTAPDLDALLACAAPSAPAGAVVGNGVDTAGLPCKSPAEHQQARAELLALADLPTSDDRPIALFIGSWHPPNIEAATLILELAARRTDWLFILAGSHTSEFARTEVPANVHMIAIFAEPLLWPLLAGADVALNPMQSGGGSNLKLFDYLAVGTTVVTTEIGARGLPNPAEYTIVAEPTVAAFSTSIDQAFSGRNDQARRSMQQAGRDLVEESFDWQSLGRSWTAAVLDGTSVSGGTPRRRSLTEHRPVLSMVAPPSSDPVIATVQLLGQQARTAPPSAQEVSMDPALRERLKKANDNRHIGRVLPDGARFTAPKKALIRVGHALTNEQVIYNQAMVEAVEQLAVALKSIEAEQRELRAAVETLTAENSDLRRRLEVLE